MKLNIKVGIDITLCLIEYEKSCRYIYIAVDAKRMCCILLL